MGGKSRWRASGNARVSVTPQEALEQLEKARDELSDLSGALHQVNLILDGSGAEPGVEKQYQDFIDEHEVGQWLRAQGSGGWGWEAAFRGSPREACAAGDGGGPFGAPRPAHEEAEADSAADLGCREDHRGEPVDLERAQGRGAGRRLAEGGVIAGDFTLTRVKVCPGCGIVGEYAGFVRSCPACRGERA